MRKKIFTFLFIANFINLFHLQAQTPVVKFVITNPSNAFSINLLSYETVKIDWGNGTESVIDGPTSGQIKIDSPSPVTAGATISIFGNKINNIALNNKTISTIEFGDEADLDFLSEVYITNNNLTTLDVSKLSKLNILDCSSNSLSTIDVSKNLKLGKLTLTGNQLQSLDVSKNTELIHLSLINTGLTDLNLESNTLLQELYINDNKFVSLSLSGLSKLNTLYCANNKLRTLDISSSLDLRRLVCGNNLLESINLSSSVVELDELQCEGNALSFATLPRVAKSATVGNFTYSPQDSLYMDDRVSDMTVNLQDVYSVSGIVPGTGTQPVVSRITWFDVTDGNKSVIREYTQDNGLYTFTFDKSTPRLVMGEIRNTTYPDLRMATKTIVLPKSGTGIDETEKQIHDKEFIYNNGVLTFLSSDKNYQITLIDTLGRELFFSQSNNESIDISKFLEKGHVYLLKVSSKDKSSILKILK